MKRLGSLRKTLPALAILLALPAWHPASATVGTMPADVATASAGDTGPSIAGFRGANFGMTQAQVRGLIETDFRIAPAAINDGENPLQHTQVLTVQVPDLVPGGGTASVSYVFGYTTHRLIEINILWSAQIDPKITPAMLYQNGESLQNYFATEGFPADRSTGNVATANGILLFRATDGTGNAVLLILSGAMAKDPKSDKSILSPAALTLAYAANPQHPDIFQLTKGSF
jgi:hypothetical protein